MTRVLSIVGIVLLAAAAGSCRPYSSSADEAPDQPIAFYHKVHAGDNKIPCQYCHYTADKSVDAGIPSVQLCVGCHVPGSSAPTAVRGQAALAFPAADRDKQAATANWRGEATKLVDFWRAGQPIPWVRIHKVPDHVKFPHYMHVNAGLKCQTCHGPVQTMNKVYQFSSLRMGWCIDCHRGKTPLSEQEDASVQARSSYIRRLAELSRKTDLRGQQANWPRQRATTDCMACHY